MAPKNVIDPTELLTPENCQSSSRIRAFLRLSRIASDDTIRQHLNEVKSTKECDNYFKATIVPQWKARASAIQYCSDYATNLRRETIKGNTVVTDKLNKPELDLRVDPYALKKYNLKLDSQFTQCDSIDNWVKNEKVVEDIIREQTADVLDQKCYYQNWIEEFNKLKALI